MDEKIVPIRQIRTQKDIECFLRGNGLAISEEAVRQVVDVLRGKSNLSLYALWHGRRGLDGRRLLPICGKGTVDKVRDLYQAGRLKEYVNYLEAEERGSIEPGDAEAGPIGVASAASLPTNLVNDQIKGAMIRHWRDLRNEAGKWRDRVGKYDVYELRSKIFIRLDYAGKFPSPVWEMPYVDGTKYAWSLAGDGSLLFRCLMDHLREEVPETYENFREWRECLRWVAQEITIHRMNWQGVTDGYIEKEQARLDTHGLGCPPTSARSLSEY